MPTYSYACTECGHRFDKVQAFTDDALTTCDQCSGRLRKLFNSVGVVFKGSGFYRTDSREASKKSSTNGSSSSDSGSNGSGSGDTKSSASGESKSSGSGEKASSSPAPAAAAASS
ncbi:MULTISPECIES: FmdB family zinc ribbon protein [Mycobacterium]|uniref:Putative regulatory protein FmdB zinc ribbon domain-containing protein n=1 Tax=Mycobacterium kiyosense TaxID=2871094 RepID=A0A9P3Q950_9MYCO|nr:MULTISPECIES: FmdB family zinc ribbon protein [Mycobacterium]BDB44766.1 hypothetical protein IWGMT90018_52120 [Mycobacterium kiyosense]BDE16260.1 hypothetical protein MKCMC460_51200 [Mycobacterium sp. 20KCMC460]GLB83591.1 hypothetical protein SRL2020028_28470 [Mycobacterium kiyosense]GLB89755.1 hypothetical protein SRL2020130_25720 [Mycobacterium kiyosense]GLB97621.1 hypothetical protein SRL2020226_43970 [Mycobacterium kiyosense]